MRILLVQTSFLGDTILSTPVIAGIKRLYPEAALDVLVTRASAALLREDPLISRIITFDKRGLEAGLSGVLRKASELRANSYDRAYVLQRSLRTALLLSRAGIGHITGFRQGRLSFWYDVKVDRPKQVHEVERNLSILSKETDIKTLPDALRLTPPSSGTREHHELVPERPTVLVPGSAWPTKRWDWRNFRALAERLCGEGHSVIVCGSAEEKAYNEQIAGGLKIANLSGELGLPDLLYVLSRARLVVCNDSMALHAACALQVPLVAVFCATGPEFGFSPWKNPRALVVEKTGLPCKPCRRHGSLRCPTGTEACMKELEVSAVYTAAMKVLE